MEIPTLDGHLWAATYMMACRQSTFNAQEICTGPRHSPELVDGDCVLSVGRRGATWWHRFVGIIYISFICISEMEVPEEVHKVQQILSSMQKSLECRIW